MGLLRVGHDCATSLSLFTFMHWRRKWQPTPVCLPGESQGWEQWAAVSRVAQSWTRLKRLSSSSSSHSSSSAFPMSLRIRAIITITTCRVCMSLSLLYFPSTSASVTAFQVPRHSRTLSRLSSLIRMVFLQISACFKRLYCLESFLKYNFL